jgi:hypothetical protein
MTPELDKFLCKTYPKLFVNRHADKRTTCMCWGFDIGDGWGWIINNLCAAIQTRIDNTRPKPQQVIVDQVKEKFGTLHLYFHGGDDEVSGMVRFAEWLSGVTCEACGSTNMDTIGRTTKGWLKTCCKDCIPKLLNNDPSVYKWKSHRSSAKAYARKKAKAYVPTRYADKAALDASIEGQLGCGDCGMLFSVKTEKKVCPCGGRLFKR